MEEQSRTAELLAELQQARRRIAELETKCAAAQVLSGDERERMQATLEAETVRRRILFDESPDGILVIDPQTTGFLEFNTTAHMQLGYSREEFTELRILDVEAQESAEETRTRIGEVLRTGRADFETLQRTKQGELRNVQVTAQIVEIAGQPVYYCTWRDITERKRAEAARRESDDRYQLLFENMVQGVVFQDGEGQIIQANPAAEQILGLTFDQMQGRTSLDPRWHSIHEDGSAFSGETHPAMVALRTGLTVKNVVMGVFNPETVSYRWLNISAVPRFLEEATSPYQVFTTFEDITAHKQAEEALLEKLRLREQLEKTASIAPNMLHIFKRDPNGKFNMPYASLAMMDIYGLHPSEVAEDMAPVFDRIEVQDIPLIQTTIAGSADTLTPWRAEFRYHHPRKGLRWLAGHSTPVCEPDGSYLWYGVIEDITESKLADEKMRESEQKYRDLINAMNDTVWVLDFETRILDVNNAAVNLLGYSQAELLSMRIGEIDTSLKPEEIKQLADLMPVEEWQVFETYHTTKAGRKIPVEVSSSPVTYQGKTAIMSIARDISERKQAQEQLARAERRYRSLIENAPDGIVLIDAESKFKYLSPSVARIFGYSPEEAQGADPAEMTHPDDLPRVLAALSALIQDPTYKPTLQYRFLHKNGEWRWIESTFSNLLALESVEAIIINFRDIHARKLTEEALSNSQARLTEAQRIGRIGHMEWNGQDPAFTCSDEIYAIFGLPPGTRITQETIASLLTPGERQKLVALDLECIKQRSDVNYEYQIQTRHGEVRWLHQLGKITYSEQGTPVRMLATIQDITERKRSELLLQESEERFRTVADFTYDLEYWLGENQQFEYISPSCERITGYSREELRQNPALLRRMVHPEDRERYDYHERIELTTPAPVSLDYRIITADGEERWISHACQGVVGLGGEARGRRVSIRDITERKQAEEQIRQQMEDLALINAVNEAANRGESFERIAGLLTGEFRRIFQCEDAGVYLMAPDQQSLELQYTTLEEDTKKRIEKLIGRPIPKIQIPLRAGSFFFRILNSERGVVIHDPLEIQRLILEFTETSSLPAFARPAIKALVPQIFKLLGIRSVVAFPLKSAKGVLGVVEISSSNLLTERQLERMQNVRSALTEILQRKQIEQRLMASEEKYRGLMESLNNAVATVDYDGTFLYLNDMTAEKLGGKPDDFTGKKMQEFFPQDDAARQLAAIQAAFERDQEGVYETLSLTSDGLRWYRVALQPLHDNAGKVSQVLVNAMDIHDLKTTQQELQELNQTLEERVKERTAQVQDLYDNAPTGYHSLNAEGKYIAINQTELDWLGYTREEVIGHPVREFLTEASIAIFEKTFPVIKQTGKAEDIELEMHRKDGSTFLVMVNASILYDENGEYLASRSTLVDITRRKQAENELIRAMNFTNAVLNALPTPVFFKDPQGRYQGCNRAFTEVTGVSAEEIRGKTVHQLWQSEHAEVYHQADLELMRRQEPQVYEAAVVDQQGVAHPVIFVKDVYHDESGKVAGMVGAFIDISERKRAEDTLRLANLELARAMRMKDEFLANMSHELRTPLNGVLGLAEALQLQTYGVLNERQLRALRNIENSGRHLLSLINDVLDLSKIEAGKLELFVEPVLMAELVQASLSFVNEMAVKKGITVNYQIDPQVKTVQVDLRRIKQILVNLLTNAVKFTPAGGEITLAVRGNREQRTAELAVSDTGIGIAADDLVRLFTPFTQIDSSLTRHYEGTGLGLALVKELAELHGGSVRVNSEVGLGSTFTVCIPWEPVVSAVQITASGAAAGTNAAAEAAPKPRATILLAEDVELGVITIADYLESKGYQMVVAANGYEAIEKARLYSPDIILMDVQMPEMDGLEATRRLRAEPRFARVPIIAVTAMAMSGDRERCLAAGATEYVSKPVGLKNLAVLIEKLLESSQ